MSLFKVLRQSCFSQHSITASSVFRGFSLPKILADCESALFSKNLTLTQSATMIQSIHADLQANKEQLLTSYSSSAIPQFSSPLTYSLPDCVKVSSVREISDFTSTKTMSKNLMLLHSLAHIEFNAMKSYLDTALRFSHTIENMQDRCEFLCDMLEVSSQESDHFQLLLQRLGKDGVNYGDIPVHSALVDNVKRSMHHLDKRIAVISIIQEGKGVDAGERLMIKLQSFQDKQGSVILKKILDEEVDHIRIGYKWFKKICEQQQVSHIERFKEICEEEKVKFFKPFNRDARVQAGYDEEWINEVWEAGNKQER